MGWKTLAGVGLLGFALGAMPVAGPGVEAEGRPLEETQAQSDEQVGPAAGLFSYSGGPVRGKRARTQTEATTIAESANWVDLPLAGLSWFVPAGTTDLLNISFSAECRLFSGSSNDYVRIRILHNSVPVEPYDGRQAFCSANGYATYTGNWVTRAAAGNHVLKVQLWILDVLPGGALSAWIDDWTFELVAYD